ncbi:alpha/beta fold hydrolase [Pseudolysinimonas kribbensis]|nr:alpha/beta fold hydrolase [Pseudolysinimonas kribbensis]
MTHMTFEVASGHRLGISGLGEPASTKVAVLCHAAPGTGAIDPDPLASNRSGLRIIGIDRPGYGASDRYEGEPDLDVWLADVRDYLSRLDPTSREASGLDIEFAGVIGIGYGAFYAAALAATVADCPRLVLLEPSAPLFRSEALDDPSQWDAEGVDPMSGAVDRQRPALDAADSYGAAADHLLLADLGWTRRVRDVHVDSTVIGVPDDAGTAWWSRHLHHPRTIDLPEGGLPGLGFGWGTALTVLGGAA